MKLIIKDFKNRTKDFSNIIRFLENNFMYIFIFFKIIRNIFLHLNIFPASLDFFKIIRNIFPTLKYIISTELKIIYEFFNRNFY